MSIDAVLRWETLYNSVSYNARNIPLAAAPDPKNCCYNLVLFLGGIILLGGVC